MYQKQKELVMICENLEKIYVVGIKIVSLPSLVSAMKTRGIKK
jgi:hypothetical protein